MAFREKDPEKIAANRAQAQADFEAGTGRAAEYVRDRDERAAANLERAAARSERRAAKQGEKVFWGRRRAAKAAGQATALHEQAQRVRDGITPPPDDTDA